MVVTLTLGDGSQVETTASHPWWVESRRSYIRTDHLEIGDWVLSAGGSTLTVTDISEPQGDQQVYNLSITGPHTYYVSTGTILVHNFSCPKATFVADANGTVIPTSRVRLEEGFQNAGLPARPATKPGTIYTLPDGTQARVMDASGPNLDRVIFENASGYGINPFTGKQPQPPKPKPVNWNNQSKYQTHLELNP